MLPMQHSIMLQPRQQLIVAHCSLSLNILLSILHYERRLFLSCAIAVVRDACVGHERSCGHIYMFRVCSCALLSSVLFLAPLVEATSHNILLALTVDC
jgi:hypothetical protein